jgi:hypothetical protein
LGFDCHYFANPHHLEQSFLATSVRAPLLPRYTDRFEITFTPSRAWCILSADQANERIILGPMFNEQILSKGIWSLLLPSTQLPFSRVKRSGMWCWEFLVRSMADAYKTNLCCAWQEPICSQWDLPWRRSQSCGVWAGWWDVLATTKANLAETETCYDLSFPRDLNLVLEALADSVSYGFLVPSVPAWRSPLSTPHPALRPLCQQPEMWLKPGGKTVANADSWWVWGAMAQNANK